MNRGKGLSRDKGAYRVTWSAIDFGPWIGGDIGAVSEM